MASPKLVAVAGSPRADSYTGTALEYALDAAETAGADTELLELGRLELPLFRPESDRQDDGANVTGRIREADAVLLGTPASHGTISATLKNALEYCLPDEFEGTTVGLLAVAGGGMYGTTLEHLRLCIRVLHGWVLPYDVGIPHVGEQFDADGDFVDSELEASVRRLGRMTVEYTPIEPTTGR